MRKIICVFFSLLLIFVLCIPALAADETLDFKISKGPRGFAVLTYEDEEGNKIELDNFVIRNYKTKGTSKTGYVFLLSSDTFFISNTSKSSNLSTVSSNLYTPINAVQYNDDFLKQYEMLIYYPDEYVKTYGDTLSLIKRSSTSSLYNDSTSSTEIVRSNCAVYNANDPSKVSYHIQYPPDMSVFNYTTTNTNMDGVLNQILDILPICIFCIVSFIALRKGISFISSTLHKA